MSSIAEITFQGGGLRDEDISASAAISATKLKPRRSADISIVDSGTAVAAASKMLHVVRGATGTLVGIEAAVATAATGADRTVTVDLHKATGGGAFATVLSSTIGFTNSSTPRVPYAGVINSTSIVDGDVLLVVVTVAGSAGAQALGLVVSLHYDEDPA